MNTKKVVITILLILFLLAFTAGGSYLYYLKNHYASVTLSAQKQTETTEILNMPDCGWYQLYAYRLEPDTPIDNWHLYLHKNDEDGNPCRLALLEFNLSSYRSKELDSAAKNNIENVLNRFQAANIHVIIRFLYDWDGKGLETEPETLAIIKKHMKQTSSIINPFHNMIYTTQGIFVGSWGEMHTSRHLSTRDMTELLLYYASVTDSSIYLAVRTPEQYRNILQELESHGSRYKKYNISQKALTARLGLYNDGMLGSLSDVGTYHAADIAPDQEAGKQIRQKEIAFQKELCLQVPNGGEAVNDNPYNDGENAINDLRSMRVSYLNQIYDEKVIQKWKASTYTGKDTLYHGMTSYDYITRHLGSRFVLLETKLHYTPYQSGAASGTVRITNTGFSTVYRDKTATVELINKKNGRKTTLFSTAQNKEEYSPRHWTPGETITLPLKLNPFHFESGEYTMLFTMSDTETDEPVPLANDSYNEGLNGYVLGTVTIEHD